MRAFESVTLPDLPKLRTPLIGAAGYVTVDQHVVLDAEIVVGGNITASVSQGGGGSSANVACAIASLGGEAIFLGHAGADPIGTGLLAELRERGVDFRVHRAGRSVVIVCLIHANAQRSFLFDPGHALQMTSQDVDPKWLDGLGLVHFTSFPFFTEPAATAFKLLAKRARKQGLPITIDAGAANAITDFGVPRYLELLQEIRPAVLFLNEDEAAVLGIGETLLGTRIPEGVGLCVVHRGPQTTICVTDTQLFEVDVPDADEILDTTGAGDAFAGGFLAAWAQGADLKTAVDVAHRLAVYVLGNVESRLPLGRTYSELLSA